MRILRRQIQICDTTNANLAANQSTDVIIVRKNFVGALNERDGSNLLVEFGFAPGDVRRAAVGQSISCHRGTFDRCKHIEGDDPDTPESC